jgi:hypothetical protein
MAPWTADAGLVAESEAEGERLGTLVAEREAQPAEAASPASRHNSRRREDPQRFVGLSLRVRPPALARRDVT